MIIQYLITAEEWTPISTVGQSGACWLDEQNDGAGGQVDVRIWHGSVPTDAEITKAKRAYRPNGNTDVLLLGADDTNDIYYARCANVGDTATLSVDMI